MSSVVFDKIILFGQEIAIAICLSHSLSKSELHSFIASYMFLLIVVNTATPVLGVVLAAISHSSFTEDVGIFGMLGERAFPASSLLADSTLFEALSCQKLMTAHVECQGCDRQG